MPDPLSQTPPPFYRAGEIASLSAALIWAGSITAYRRWGRDVPPHTLNLFKSFVATVCLSLSILLLRPPVPSDPVVWLQLILSGVVGLAIGDTAFFASLRRLGAQAASSGFCLSPPVTLALGAIWLGETLNTPQALGVAFTVPAVAGVLYFGKRGPTPMASLPAKTIAAGIFYTVLSATANGVGLVIAREALQKTNVVWGTFLRMAPCFLFLSVLRHFDRPRVPLRASFREKRQVLALLAASFAGTFVGVMLLSVGSKYAKAGLVATLSSTFPLWVIPIARVFLKEHTNRRCVFCTLLAVAGICLMFVPEAQLEEFLALFSP